MRVSEVRLLSGPLGNLPAALGHWALTVRWRFTPIGAWRAARYPKGSHGRKNVLVAQWKRHSVEVAASGGSTPPEDTTPSERPHTFARSGVLGGSRTPTGSDLNAVPLPLGYEDVLAAVGTFGVAGRAPGADRSKAPPNRQRPVTKRCWQ